jgi:hypothetical protein
MGQYRLSFYFHWQIGFLFRYVHIIKSIDIQIPFITVYIGLTTVK